MLTISHLPKSTFPPTKTATFCSRHAGSPQASLLTALTLTRWTRTKEPCLSYGERNSWQQMHRVPMQSRKIVHRPSALSPCWMVSHSLLIRPPHISRKRDVLSLPSWMPIRTHGPTSCADAAEQAKIILSLLRPPENFHLRGCSKRTHPQPICYTCVRFLPPMQSPRTCSSQVHPS